MTPAERFPPGAFDIKNSPTHNPESVDNDLLQTPGNRYREPGKGVGRDVIPCALCPSLSEREGCPGVRGPRSEVCPSLSGIYGHQGGGL